MNINIETNVLDAGGRYGLHPTWKSFSGEMKYFLFEPDEREAERLRIKYNKRSDEIEIYTEALLDVNGRSTINYFKNRAMSSMCNRNPVVVQYQGERKDEPLVVESSEVNVTTVDSFCNSRGINLDFIKLDTEGTEHQILQGANDQITNNVLGIRSEVAFDRIFEGMPMFSQIHEWLMSKGFFLLNLSYDGRGDYSNEYVNIRDGKYGILTNSDGVWLKRESFIYESLANNPIQTALSILKYAAFCLNNSASDLAIDILLKAKSIHNLDFNPIKDSKLFNFVDISIQKLFYGLKWQPGQSLESHNSTYKIIFEKPMLQMHEFNESAILNPD